MGTIVTISFASILLLSFFAETKKDERLMNVRDFLLMLVSIGIFLDIKSGTNDLLYMVTSAFLSLTFVLSFFNRLNGLLKHVLPVVLLPIFVVVDQPLVYGEYAVSFSSYSTLLFIGLGYLLPQMINLKSLAVTRILGVEKNDVSLTVGPAILGIVLFAATFFHSTAGLFLVSIGLWAGVLLHKGQGKNLALFSLGMLMVHPFLSMANLDAIDLTLGKTIEGLLFGAFSVLFVIKMSTRSSKQILSSLISSLMVMFLFAFLLILGTQKTDFGGVDAFIAGIYGMSLMFLASNETEWKSTIFISVILTGLIVVPMTVDTKVDSIDRLVVQNTTVSKSTAEKVLDPFDQKGLELNSIVGMYTIDEKNMDFTFELGPKGGRTKGKFKALKGSVNILNPLANSEFDVQLNVADLSTLNKFRDESLMGEEYFNVTKFPGMSFKSKKLNSKDDAYELAGEFTMMGVKKQQVVTIKLVSGNESGSTPVLIGKGTVDRTLFGMKPDPKEGNVVDFQFTIQLIKAN